MDCLYLTPTLHFVRRHREGMISYPSLVPWHISEQHRHLQPRPAQHLNNTLNSPQTYHNARLTPQRCRDPLPPPLLHFCILRHISLHHLTPLHRVSRPSPKPRAPSQSSIRAIPLTSQPASHYQTSTPPLSPPLISSPPSTPSPPVAMSIPTS